MVSKLLALSALAVVTTAAVALGPPRVTVTEVSGTPPTPNAVLQVVAEHHDHGPPELSARVLTLHNGIRVSNPIRVTAASRPGVFGIARQWEAGAPAVIVVTLRQGDDAPAGVAEAMVKVNDQGRITGITTAMGTNLRRDRFPRAFTSSELDAALREM
jgi:hypothetical protein